MVESEIDRLQENSQRMQNKVDKLKLLNLTNNVHSLSPPQKGNEAPRDDIALITGLSVQPRLIKMCLDLLGKDVDSKGNLIDVGEPVMNPLGVTRFKMICSVIAQETEWATYSEEEMPQREIYYFEENLPHFIFYKDLYELKSHNFNIVKNYLCVFIDAAFHKAKQGKFINTLGRTYSEDLLNKALSNEQTKKKKEDEWGINLLNPLRR